MACSASGSLVKWGGGAVATVVVLVLVPFADAIFGQPDLTVPLVVAAFIPLAQAPEGIAGASMIVAGRYDLRAIFGGLAMVLAGSSASRSASSTASPWAVVGILLGQIAGSCASGYAGHRLVLGATRPPVASGCDAIAASSLGFVLQVGHRHIARLDAQHARAARARHRRPDRPGRLLPGRAGADHRASTRSPLPSG